MTTRALMVAAMLLSVNLTTAAAQAPSLPQLPPSLEVPAGNELYLAASAEGTQNYVCLPDGAGAKWRFVGPQATLFQQVKGGPPQQITTHFLSTNPTEAPTARPTWQHSVDSSRVWAQVLGHPVTDPNYVEAGAIPWLLLQAAGTENGRGGGKALSTTTFIQRVNTSGGTAAASDCSVVGHIGKVALVPYTTDYFFYRAIRP